MNCLCLAFGHQAKLEDYELPVHIDESVTDLRNEIDSNFGSLTANIYGTGDFTIELKYCKWLVHQAKFAAASKFFAKAMETGIWMVRNSVDFTTIAAR